MISTFKKSFVNSGVYYKQRIQNNYLNRQTNNDYYELSSEPHFNKRSIRSVTQVIDLLIICDYYCFKRHEELLNTNDEEETVKHIKAYYSSVIAITNNLFKRSLSNTTKLSIEFNVKSYVILINEKSSEFSSNSSHFIKIDSKDKDDRGRKYLNCDLALPTLNDWLAMQSDSSHFPEFDVAVVFSYLNLYSSNSDILGFSVVGGLCNVGTNGLFIEDNGGFSCVKTLAHELAHNIGIYFILRSFQLK